MLHATARRASGRLHIRMNDPRAEAGRRFVVAEARTVALVFSRLALTTSVHTRLFVFLRWALAASVDVPGQQHALGERSLPSASVASVHVPSLLCARPCSAQLHNIPAHIRPFQQKSRFQFRVLATPSKGRRALNDAHRLPTEIKISTWGVGHTEQRPTRRR